MKKLLKNKINIIIIIAIFLPHSVFAATIYLETARTEFFVGDTILVDVKVNSENKEINTVEGNVSLTYLPDVVVVKDIILSESSFSLWPNKPSLSEDLKTISFVGGTPLGLKSQNATLFKIVLNLKKVGQVILNPTDTSVYLNDGKGTKDSVNNKDLTLDILPKKDGSNSINDWDILISEDKTPPKSFEIVVGQDGSVFDGNKFLSFSTIDEQSGLRYYEVIEGNLPPTRSSGTYVLQNQDKSNKVTVIAYDASGNFKKETYNPKYSYFNFNNIAIIIIFAILLFVIFKKRNKK